jgi:hypothetical protein
MTPTSRLKTLYLGISAIVFGAFILFGGANIAFYVALQFKEHIKAFVAPSNPVGDKYGSTLRDAYPEMSMAEINDLLVETWTRPQSYDPVVQFREGALRGKYVNVDNAGFRLSADQGTWPPRAENHNIFVFGSSSTFGYGLPDHQTIPSYLQEKLAFLSDRPVKVYNFGRGLFYSTQERRLFERLLFQGYVPDSAIFIDGLSEYSSTGSGFPFTKQLSQALNSDILPRLGWTMEAMPLYRLYSWLKKRLHRSSALTPSNNQIAANPQMDPEHVGTLTRRYLLNANLTDVLAKNYGVEALYVWQPVSTYLVSAEAVPLRNVDMGNHVHAGKAYGLARSELEKHFAKERFVWCADIQADIAEPLYVDAVHYNARASRLLASCIADTIDRKNLFKTGSK